MAGFFVLFPILFGGHGGGDGIRRCRKCGEPVTRAGKLMDRHPSLVLLWIVLAAAMISFPLISFMNWTVDRNFPDLYGGEENVDTYAHYVRYELRGIRDTVKHLW